MRNVILATYQQITLYRNRAMVSADFDFTASVSDSDYFEKQIDVLPSKSQALYAS